MGTKNTPETGRLVVDAEFARDWQKGLSTARGNETEYLALLGKESVSTVPGRVGQGGRVHNLVVKHVDGKIVDVSCWCGSQKFNGWATSGLALLDVKTQVTCKRCAKG